MPRRKSSGRLRPPRTTRASSGIRSGNPRYLCSFGSKLRLSLGAAFFIVRSKRRSEQSDKKATGRPGKAIFRAMAHDPLRGCPVPAAIKTKPRAGFEPGPRRFRCKLAKTGYDSRSMIGRVVNGVASPSALTPALSRRERELPFPFALAWPLPLSLACPFVWSLPFPLA
jgi:hypothetical protein